MNADAIATTWLPLRLRGDPNLWHVPFGITHITCDTSWESELLSKVVYGAGKEGGVSPLIVKISWPETE